MSFNNKIEEDFSQDYTEGVKLVSRSTPHNMVFKYDISNPQNRSSKSFLEVANEKMCESGDKVGALMFDFFDLKTTIPDEFINEALSFILSVLSSEKVPRKSKSVKEKEMPSSSYVHLKLSQTCAFHSNLKKACTNYLDTVELSHVEVYADKNVPVNNFAVEAKKQQNKINALGYNFSEATSILDKIRLAFKVIRDGNVKDLSYFLRESGFFPQNKSFGLGMDNWVSKLQDLVQFETLEGITLPYDYIGLLMSIFAIHVEDFWSTNSANFLWAGEPKVWVIIPPSEYTKVNDFYLKYLLKKGKFTFQCELQHKVAFIHPTLLDKWGIKYSIFVQEPGMMVITKTMCYHEGFNLGLNWARSTNLTLCEYGKTVIGIDLRFQCTPSTCQRDVSGDYAFIPAQIELVIIIWFSFEKNKLFVPLYPYNEEWWKLAPARHLLLLFSNEVQENGGVIKMAAKIARLRGKIDKEGSVINAVEKLLSYVNEFKVPQNILVPKAIKPSVNNAVRVSQDLQFILDYQRMEGEDGFVSMYEIVSHPNSKVKHLTTDVHKMLFLLANVKQNNHSHFSNWRLNQLALFAINYGMSFTVRSKSGMPNVVHGFEINPLTNMPILKCLCAQSIFGTNKSKGTVLLQHLRERYKRNLEQGLIVETSLGF